MEEESSTEPKTLADRLNVGENRAAATEHTVSERVVTEEKLGAVGDASEQADERTDSRVADAKKVPEECNEEYRSKISEEKESTGKDRAENDQANGCNIAEGYSQVNEDFVPHVGMEKDDVLKEETGNTDSSNMCKSCDNFADSHETLDENASEESSSDGEYESAEEGEEIQVDQQSLRELEESLTGEEKEERRKSAQVLKEEGNEYFRSGSYKTAIKTYSRALRTCPLKYQKDRAIMYSNRGACKMRLEDYESAIKDCSRAVELHPHYMKALMRRAELYEKTEKLDEALADFQKILELDPSQHSARAACARLPDMIKERNEKMKEEMMAKLKDLGNMILRPFGLSTNNFNLNQDPNTGGYSVNFVQNPEQSSQ